MSYQETDEDEKTARNRTILTAEHKENQTRQLEEERLRYLRQPQEEDKIRSIAEEREDQQRIKRKWKEEVLRRRNDRWEDEDRVVRKRSSESSKNSPVKEKQRHYAPDVPKSQKRYGSDQDCDSNNPKWGYSDEPRSFETQSDDRKRKETLPSLGW